MHSLDLIVKAAEVAVKAHVRRPPSSAAGKMKKAGIPTLAMPAKQLSSHVDILKHLAGQAGLASPSHLEEMSKYFKGFAASPTGVAGQQALSAAASKAKTIAPAAASTVARKLTPTVQAPATAVLQHAAKTLGPERVIQGAVQHGAPVIGSADVLKHLEQSSFGKLATDVDVVMGRMKALASPEAVLQYGLPGVFGALSGAEHVPDNKLLGMLLGGAGSIGGSHLGSHVAKTIGSRAGLGKAGMTIADLIGQVIGSGVGTDVGVRSARLLKDAGYTPPASLTPKHVVEALEKLKAESAAKRLAQGMSQSVQKARFDARQMGASVGKMSAIDLGALVRDVKPAMRVSEIAKHVPPPVPAAAKKVVDVASKKIPLAANQGLVRAGLAPLV